MDIKTLIKKGIKGIAIVTAWLILYFLGCGAIIIVLYKIFGEEKSYVANILMVILSTILGFILCRKAAKETKKWKIEEKQNFMQSQIAVIIIFILIEIISLIVFTVMDIKIGIITTLVFILALVLWATGAYLGYRNLQRDIESINQKLRERNNENALFKKS